MLEANKTEPLLKCRKRMDAIKTREWSLPWDKSGRNLITDQTVTGMQAARTTFWLLYGTWEPKTPMLMEKSKWKYHHKDESTNAEYRRA